VAALLHHLAMPAGLSSKPFRYLWAATGGANLADGVLIAAAPLLAATLTRDPLLVAALIIAQRLPWLLFTLPSGVIVDRLDRRHVMIAANGLRGAAVALLAVYVAVGSGGLLVLYAVAFLVGIAETLADNAAIAILPPLVDDGDLERANGRIFATQSAANELVGPPVGAALFAATPAAAFAAAAAGFMLAAGLLGRIHGRFRADRESPDGPGVENEPPKRTLLAELREGLRWFIGSRLFRLVAGMAAVVNFCSAAALGILVLVAQERLGVNATGYGLLLAVGAVGGIAGGFVAGPLVNRVGPGTALFISNLLPAIGYAGMALTRSPYVAATMLALFSAGGMVANVVVITLRQAAVPAHLLGRVTSAYRMVVMGALPLGALVGGAVARESGLTAPLWTAAAIMGAMAVGLLPILTNRALTEARSVQPRPAARRWPNPPRPGREVVK
jgi:MFS family permease